MKFKWFIIQLSFIINQVVKNKLACDIRVVDNSQIPIQRIDLSPVDKIKRELQKIHSNMNAAVDFFHIET